MPPQSVSKETLMIIIENFLANRRKSHGGWAEITGQDYDDLDKIIHYLIDLKCEKDPDGDYPLDFWLVNRTKEYMPSYMPVIYHHNIETDEELEASMKVIMLNAAIAFGELERFMSLRDSKKERIEKKTKG